MRNPSGVPLPLPRRRVPSVQPLAKGLKKVAAPSTDGGAGGFAAPVVFGLLYDVPSVAEGSPASTTPAGAVPEPV